MCPYLTSDFDAPRPPIFRLEVSLTLLRLCDRYCLLTNPADAVDDKGNFEPPMPLLILFEGSRIANQLTPWPLRRDHEGEPSEGKVDEKANMTPNLTVKRPLRPCDPRSRRRFLGALIASVAAAGVLQKAPAFQGSGRPPRRWPWISPQPLPRPPTGWAGLWPRPSPRPMAAAWATSLGLRLRVGSPAP